MQTYNIDLIVILKVNENILEGMNNFITAVVRKLFSFLIVMVGQCIFVNRGCVCVIVINLLKQQHNILTRILILF